MYGRVKSHFFIGFSCPFLYQVRSRTTRRMAVIMLSGVAASRWSQGSGLGFASPSPTRKVVSPEQYSVD